MSEPRPEGRSAGSAPARSGARDGGREGAVIDALIKLADTLIEDYDVIEFLTMLSERCVALVDADEAGIMIADPHGRLQVVASSSERTRLLELFELRNDDGPCLEAFNTGHVVVSSDLGADGGRWPSFSEQARSVGFRSVHSVPLRLRERTIGSLNLLRVEIGSLQDPDVALVRALAEMATIGLLQQRAVSESRLTSAQLQTALDSRVRIEQAKGMISERHGVSIDEAFTLIRAFARRHRRPLGELAQAIAHDDFDIGPSSPASG